MKKRVKRFLGTLVIIGVFVVGTVFGSEAILKFTGTNTIDEAETLIQKLIQERNTIVDEYNELDSTATEKIKSLENDINSLKVDIQTLTQERDKLQTKYNELSGCEPYSTIVSLQNKIKSLEAEIARKDAELNKKDISLKEKDNQLKSKDDKITNLENELKIANSKCEELQDVIDGIPESGFQQSDLVKDNN